MQELWRPRRGRLGYPSPYVPAYAFLSTLSQRHLGLPDYASRPVRSSTGGVAAFDSTTDEGDARGAWLGRIGRAYRSRSGKRPLTPVGVAVLLLPAAAIGGVTAVMLPPTGAFWLAINA